MTLTAFVQYSRICQDLVIHTVCKYFFMFIRCNSWSPFYKKERDAEGLILSLEMLNGREEFLCEKPINATCREATSKSFCLAAEYLLCSHLCGCSWRICHNNFFTFLHLIAKHFFVSLPNSQNPIHWAGPDSHLQCCGRPQVPWFGQFPGLLQLWDFLLLSLWRSLHSSFKSDW